MGRRGVQETMGTQKEERDPERGKREGSTCGWSVEAAALIKKREVREGEEEKGNQRRKS